MSTAAAYDAQTTTLDFLMMYAAHDAFRRDAARLLAATSAGPGARTGAGDLAAFRGGWEVFRTYLTIHHTAEDTHLWPPVRGRLGGDPEGEALLDDMEAEHAVLDPLMESVDAQLAAGDTARLRATVAELGEALAEHLEHEEAAGLPLVDAVLTAAEWDAFGQAQRQAVGLRGGAHFFPWLLEGAPPAVERRVLALVPPPVRFLYRWRWRPRYLEDSPWGRTA